jgi:glutamate racemase
MNHQMKNRPIGVFDSGLGGLTVVKELIRQLPGEDIVYYGDTARVPYGTKSKESIIRFSGENAAVLMKYGVKMIVVACNSSSSYALPALRKNFSVPIIGVIRPGARKAVEVTRGKRVGVIATSATVRSQAYVKAIRRCDSSVRVFSRPCPLFVPLVEEGWALGSAARRAQKKIAFDIAREYLAPLKERGIDVLILGCTHYPLLADILQRAVGGGVTLIDSAQEVALEVKRTLDQTRTRRISSRRAKHRFLISDRPQEFERLAKNFLGHEIRVVCCKS